MFWNPDILLQELLFPDQALEFFPFERELRLFQFQTWIYKPTPESAPDEAGALAATKILQVLDSRYQKKAGKVPARNSALKLIKCLEDETYSSIYKMFIGKFGGWPLLLTLPSARDFDQKLSKKKKESEAVCEIMDYRFRYLDHDGKDKGLANLSHGYFFRWKAPKRKYYGGRALRNKWSNTKNSSVFLYASERLGPSFFPPKITDTHFIDEISARAADLPSLRRFFGVCAYVAETLQDSDPDDVSLQIPQSIERVRPNTLPISPEEQERMKDYNEKIDEMRNS